MITETMTVNYLLRVCPAAHAVFAKFGIAADVDGI